MEGKSDTECILCQDESVESPIIDYSHNCGNYKIHQSCLDEWFIKNSSSCLICRNNIINSSSSSTNSSSTSSSSENSNSDHDYDASVSDNNDDDIYDVQTNLNIIQPYEYNNVYSEEFENSNQAINVEYERPCPNNYILCCISTIGFIIIFYIIRYSL